MVLDNNFNLKERLKILGMTQLQFAKLVEVDPTTVRAWVRTGTPGTARRLVELLEFESGLAEIPPWLVKILPYELED